MTNVVCVARTNGRVQLTSLWSRKCQAASERGKSSAILEVAVVHKRTTDNIRHGSLRITAAWMAAIP